MNKNFRLDPGPIAMARWWAIAVGVIAGSAVAAERIQIDRYAVVVDPAKSTFAMTLTAGDAVLSAGPLAEAAKSVVSKPVDSPVWGPGQSIEIVYESGDRGRFMLFGDLPFVLYQPILVNTTAQERRVAKVDGMQFPTTLDNAADNLQTMSTAGLTPASKNPGGYMFLTVADPQTRSGVVAAWLTTERGSGVVRSSGGKGAITLAPQIDYGDLRIAPNQTVEAEIVAIGQFDDVRLGLEHYASAVARQYDIKLRPLPGVYCTWYHAKSSDEQRLTQNASFAQEHLKSYGLNVMQIDDRWQGDASKTKLNGEKYNGPMKNFSGVGPENYFPSGMKEMADTLREKGFAPGLWFMPFAGTYNDPFFADKQDLFFKDDEGKPYDVFWGGTGIDMTNPRSQEYLRQNIRRFAKEWGYEYFKMDGLYTGLGVRTMYPSSKYRPDNLGEVQRHNPQVTAVESYRNAMRIIREEAGDNVFFLGCNVAQNMRTLGASFGTVDAMRVGPDNGTNWDHWKTEGKLPGTHKVGPIFSGRVYFLHGRVWYNDPDPIYVRELVPLNQARAIASWVAISGQLHNTSEDYYNLPADRIEIIRRTLASHGSLNARPVDYLENEPAQIWLLTEKISGRNHHVVGLFNWDAKEELKIEYPMRRMGLDAAASYCGFDFWENQFIAPFNEVLSLKLEPSSSRIIALRQVANHPQVVSTSRHVTQGIVDLSAEQWNPDTRTLTGTSAVVGNDPYELRIVSPAGFSTENASLVKAPEGAEISLKQEEAGLRVTIRSPQNANIEWAVKF
jgi:hypothetical protein